MKSAKDIFLILASISFVIIIGGAIYEHIAIIPSWSAAPPSSLTMYQGKFASTPGPFWMMIHPVTILFLIVSLISNWHNPRRKNILIVLVSYVVILLITAIYFVPELMSITLTPFSENVDPELVRRSSMWETLSLVRLFFIGILSFILLSALTISTEKVVVERVATVPLSYDNDSKGG